MPSPQRHRAQPRAWLRTRAFWIATLGALLVAGAALAAAALTLSHALSPATFAAMAGEGFERDFSVDRVRLALRPRPWVRVEGVAVEGLGHADAAEVELRFRPLLRGEVRARRVRLEGVHLVLERGPDGDFLPIFPSGDGGGGGLARLPRFEAESGEVRIVQGERLTAVVRLQGFWLGRFDARGEAPLVVSGNVTGGDGRWHAHPLHLRGRLAHGPEGTSLVDGRAHARHVGAGWWRGQDARARFGYEGGSIRIESLEMRAFGGSVRIAGRARLRGGMRLDVSASAESLEVATLVVAASPESTPGDLGTLLTRWTRLRVPWRHGPRWERASGEGSLRITGGTLPGHSLLAAVGAEPGPNAMASLSAPVTLEDGRLRSTELRLESEDYVLAAEGSLGLDRSLALEGRVRLSGTALPPIPVTIAGTLGAPVVDAHPSRLPGGGVGVLATGIGRTTRAAGRSVVGVLGAAGRKARELLDR